MNYKTILALSLCALPAASSCRTLQKASRALSALATRSATTRKPFFNIRALTTKPEITESAEVANVLTPEIVPLDALAITETSTPSDNITKEQITTILDGQLKMAAGNVYQSVFLKHLENNYKSVTEKLREVTTQIDTLNLLKIVLKREQTEAKELLDLAKKQKEQKDNLMNHYSLNKKK